jgi:N-acyl amino acid synthase of PEP-CTERM/exosortase system
MHDEQILNLLTQEYSLRLVITQQDIELLKEVRTKILVPIYERYTQIENVDELLYNQDDEQSFVYILIHNQTQKPVGTIRIFFINDKTPIQQLPMQTHGGVTNIDIYTKHKPICEITRLALIKDLPTHKDLSALSLRTTLTMGLFVALGMNILLYKYKSIFSIMEPSLFRIIRRHGILFEPIGETVDYFGKRIPHIITRQNLMDNANPIIGHVTLHYLKQLVVHSDEFISYIDKHPYLDRDKMHIDKLIDILQNKPDITIDELLKLM